MPRVSIIIPAYNAAALLPQTLDSIVAQTYRDWEAIVADDGSTDETAAVARDRDPRILCVRSARNRGVGGARNLAFSRARGELIALLDADDTWLPEYLERQVDLYDAALARGEDVGIVCCDAYELGPEGLRAQTYSEHAGWVEEVTLTTLLHHNTIFVSAIVPRAVLEELGGFATDCLGTEEYDLWLRILETGRGVIAAREPLVVYRTADKTMSKNATVMSHSMQTTYRHALSRGRLTRRQRSIARRELHLLMLVDRWQAIQRARRNGVPLWPVVRALPLAVHVALERFRRWPHWLGAGWARMLR
jgi:glycosyltransferase involved in cell wall biosynthesis